MTGQQKGLVEHAKHSDQSTTSNTVPNILSFIRLLARVQIQNSG